MKAPTCTAYELAGIEGPPMRDSDRLRDRAARLLALALNAREKGKALLSEENTKLAIEASDKADERNSVLSKPRPERGNLPLDTASILGRHHPAPVSSPINL